MRRKIPQHAKDAAVEGLRARELFHKKPGLDAAQAAERGINSGVERAKQIIREEYLEECDLNSMRRFYARSATCAQIHVEQLYTFK